MHLPLGMLLQGGKYEIISYISSGGFGCTYKARHAMLDTVVAVKEFFVKDYCNRDASTHCITVATQGKAELIERLRKKFIEEAQAIFNMNHTNIVRVTDIFEENGTVYYVMDYIDGCSLASLISNKGRLSESEALGYINQVADALGYVHSRNRLHLDVKPQNIMIDQDGKAVLIDFGVSKQYDEVNGENTSTLLGSTPGYAPIEQSGNGVVRFYPSADIYALGATLYKALTGVTPVAAHLRASGEELDPMPADISPATCAAVEAAMKINKARRPQSIADFLAMLTVKIEAISDSKDPGTPTEDLIATEEIEITAVTGGYVNEETRIAPKVIKDPKDSKDVNEDTVDSKDLKVSKDSKIKVPKVSSDSKVPYIVAFIIVVVVLLGAVTGLELLGMYDGEKEENSKNGNISSYASNSDSNADVEEQARLEREAEAQRQREEEERIAREAEEQRQREEQERIAREAEEQRQREEQERLAREAEAQRQREEAARLAEQQSISTAKKVDLGLSVYWAGWNVGASSPEDSGNYYAWGETTTKTNYTESSYKYHNGSRYINIGSNISGTQYDVARAQWGGSWRLPTKSEMQELVDRCTWTWTTYKGVRGYKVTGPNGNSIFLPAARYRVGTEINSRGSGGYYWSGTINEGGFGYAYCLYFSSSAHGVDPDYRTYGLSVRPVSN